MYSDPAHIRHKRLNISVTEASYRLVEASAEFNETQTTAYARELLEWALANQHLRHLVDSVGGPDQLRVAS